MHCGRNGRNHLIRPCPTFPTNGSAHVPGFFAQFPSLSVLLFVSFILTKCKRTDIPYVSQVTTVATRFPQFLPHAVLALCAHEARMKDHLHAFLAQFEHAARIDEEPLLSPHV